MNRIDPAGTSRPTKIQSHHLERWAIDYIRQSHPQQVQRHRESAQVQANLQGVRSRGAGQRNAFASSMATRAAPAPAPSAVTISPGCSRRSPWATSAWSSASRSTVWPVKTRTVVA